ncbi:plasmid recombination protein [Novosphingopyxis sp. YJ-S2-01]|uniref:plasmid recombination protein n=1 Tax=Novosphingopyxis sp. YJ-S2-01 TaxID=2794021 RepID=UPI0018DE3AA2|nr:plasmid recombination protein [Novosphingopyxis sp. YJ-S2-01]MBH9537063.1 plasmid recombination protein [Novosphingopyxis sp. YJ-S2-01]
MAEKPNYAIMRIGKIHSRVVLDAVEWHNTRQIPARTVEGAPIPDEWNSMTGRYRDRADKILKETGATHEQGKVLAVEVLVTASPEWWATASKDQMRDWWKAQYEYAEHLFGPGLLAFTPHLDESTPHAQFVGLPLYHSVAKKPGPKPKDPEKLRKRLEEEEKGSKIWRLSHDAVFGGGPVGLAKRQTEYHQFVAHLGLTRGKDTVGLGIKNIPLKHYAKLLTQMERDLARQAAELAEKSDTLEHYDAELKHGFDRLTQQRAAIEMDELDLFKRHEEARLASEQFAEREASLERRLRAISDSVGALREKEDELGQREAKAKQELAEVEERARALIQKRAEHVIQRRDLAAREFEIGERERALTKRDAEVAEREKKAKGEVEELGRQKREMDLTLAQISIVVGVFTGRLRATWDALQQRPKVIQGELTARERDASKDPWPTTLATALRHAASMAERRRSLAATLRSMLAKVRIRKAAAAGVEALAKKRAGEAKASNIAAQMRLATAMDREAKAERLEREAEARAKAARALADSAEDRRKVADSVHSRREQELARLDAQIAERQKAASRAQSLRVSEEEALANANSEVSVRRAELHALQHEIAQLGAQKAGLASEKTALEVQVASLKRADEELQRERREVKRERANLDAAKAVWDRSVTTWQRAIEDGVMVEIKDSQIILSRDVGDTQLPVEEIPVASIERSLFPLLAQVQTLKRMEHEMGDLLDDLENRRKQLAEEYPEQKNTLEKAQAEDRSAANRMWADLANQGHQQ